jgi:hypothetical protein
MKKVYMTPELEEIKIEDEMSLLAGSGVTGDGISNPPGWGGTDPGDGSVIPSAPELPLPVDLTTEGLTDLQI